ncbi:MAG: phenylalanine--tRNA ligase subunit alpha [Deltaproteobacteria bacterium]|nr:phenylalanine--tRNA ligase subunit alpha [Deltaproteobacteria bacterium]
MRADLERIRQAALADLERCEDEAALDQTRLRYLGRKGELTAVLRGMREVAAAERPAMGELANAVKTAVEERLGALRRRLADARQAKSLAEERLDVTLPGIRSAHGHLHPLTQVLDQITSIFAEMGFGVETGPEVEDDYHNFEALNIPRDHPARDMHDTFFVAEDRVLRTHTSPVQIRVMESRQPPLRVIAPGVVYRHDDDVTHSPNFLQVEGFFVDEAVTFGDLKGVLSEFVHAFFGPRIPLRFRPSFFPFTEPSAEVDIGCVMCAASGVLPDGSPCRVCKRSGWLEILGSGMIDPNVFRFVGYDPEKFSGFAFGLGVERLAMLKHGIGDIRLFYENDLRFLRQF